MSKARKFTAEVSDFVLGQLGEMTEKELLAVVKECDSLNSFNCGWTRYELRKVIKDFAENQLRLLKEEEAAGANLKE